MNNFSVIPSVVDPLHGEVVLNVQARGLLGKQFEVAVLVFSLIVYYLYQRNKSYIDLPYVGVSSWPLSAWKASFNYLSHTQDYISDGYIKHSPNGKAYAVATVPRYIVFLTDSQQIEELRRAKENELSVDEVMRMRFRLEDTLGSRSFDGKNNFHFLVIRQGLTQHLSTVLPSVVAELDIAWREIVNVGDNWSRVRVAETFSELIARTSSRALVGAPLCHNREYLDILKKFMKTFPIAGQTADHVPFFLRHGVVWWLYKKYKLQEKAAKILGPIFDERRLKQSELGDERWNSVKPQDAIQWLIDAAATQPKELQTNEQLTTRFLMLNFVAIQTAFLSTLHALYDLTTHPEYIDPLRDDITIAFNTCGGLTKQALTMMKKLDSCLKESQRCNTLIPFTMTRVALQDYTFKSGSSPLKVPKGTMVSVPSSAIHYSHEIYGPDANEWKGFRWSESNAEDKDAERRHMMILTTKDYLAFGNGNHSCPGRFFVSNELKIIFCYLLLKYDLRLPAEWGGKRPPNTYVFGACKPNVTAELELRPRKEWKEIEQRWHNSLDKTKFLATSFPPEQRL